MGVLYRFQDTVGSYSGSHARYNPTKTKMMGFWEGRVAGRDGREGEENGCRVREKKSTSLTRYFLAMESFCGLLKWGVCPALCKALH